MDNIKAILPSKKSIIAQPTDVSLNLNLESSEKQIFNNNIQNILNVNGLFNKERQNSTKYKINGQIELISLITGIKNNVTTTSGLFDYLTINDNINDFTTINDFFDIFIMYPQTYYGNNDNLKLVVKPLTNANDSDIFNAGFYKNMYYEQINQFVFNNDINITGLTTSIVVNNNQQLPITELYLFFRFKNNNSLKYQHSYTDINGIVINGNISDTNINNGLYVGDFQFDIDNFELSILKDVTCNIKFNLTGKTLNFIYNPFIPIKIRDFSNNVETGNILTTDNIPYYSILVEDETNGFNKNGFETYTISSTTFYSGTTRLVMNDPINMLPRKLIFNNNTNFFEYYLDFSNVYNTDSIIITLNGNKLIEGIDYLTSSIDTSKIILRFKPTLNDIFTFSYLKGENYVWRDLLDIGYIEPSSLLGVEYPFVNGRHYIFDYTKLFIKPDMTDLVTNQFFCKFNFKTSPSHIENKNNFVGDNC